jgi:mitotic spindle assembly checkpoint protein MAD1
MVTEERDELRNLVNEFKRPKNDEAGDEAVSGAVLQVILFFLPCLLFMRSLIWSCLWLGLRGQELESSIAKKELCIKELESSLREQKEVNTHQYEEIRLLNERLNNEARRIKSLEREGYRLRSEISLLESKVKMFWGLLEQYVSLFLIHLWWSIWFKAWMVS